MSPFSALVVYLLIWWVTLFAILPLGVRGQAEENDIVRGSEPGAPVKPELKRKFILTTLVATILWVIVCGVIITGLVDYRMFNWYSRG